MLRFWPTRARRGVDMTSIKSALPKFAGTASTVEPHLFHEAEVVVPTSVEDVCEVLKWASEMGAVVVPWGGGSHQGLGVPPAADIVLNMEGLASVESWEPEDLTVVVESGMAISLLEAQLNDGGQTALLAERPATGTVGGAVASGISGYRRGRYGPTRDRILEVTLVTGDGRLVRGGARVVKNVTGYDLPRLAVGSLGSLGVIVSVCLKLWPAPETTATIRVDDARAALATAWKPLAVLETREGVDVYFGGTGAEVTAQAAAIGGVPSDGLSWPEQPRAGGGAAWSLRVPPDLVSSAIERLPPSWDYVAQHGVGDIACADPHGDADAAVELRSWAESSGGALVMVEANDTVRSAVDPWGTPPSTLVLQRRIVSRFDPDRVVNRGRLPGNL